MTEYAYLSFVFAGCVAGTLLGIAAHYANSLSLQRDRESAQRKLAGLPEGASGAGR